MLKKQCNNEKGTAEVVFKIAITNTLNADITTKHDLLKFKASDVQMPYFYMIK